MAYLYLHPLTYGINIYYSNLLRSLSVKQQRLTTIYKIESDQHLKFIIIPLKSEFEWGFLIIDSL
jgi:hypothetical protein